MNYYDKKMGTPFLYFDDLRGILQYFKTKQTEYWSMNGMKRHILEDNYYIQNRWILPDPSSMNEREREEEHRVLASLHLTSSRRVKYAYIGSRPMKLSHGSTLASVSSDVKVFSSTCVNKYVREAIVLLPSMST
ncbi:uncharacterized protein [Miscanthus floridulus]|uniref:uncharacterized protein isoform X1 n=1 Tax=Miscanthus floridulus TaxID=154761 RepID=UPI003457FB4C